MACHDQSCQIETRSLQVNSGQEYFRLQGSKLRMSSAYHTQTDGQTEVLNRCLETYLRCFAGSKQKQWLKWLPWAEYWYNTSYHTATRVTPFEVVYGRAPATVHNYEHGATAVAQVDQSLKERDEMLKLLKENLVTAQNRMKVSDDRHRRELEFETVDFVYLKLQPFRQLTIRTRGNMKLSPRFYGPYQVLEHLGKVAYRLELPQQSKIHPVFHVSQLKKKLGNLDHVTPELPPVKEDGMVLLEPKRIVDFAGLSQARRFCKKHWYSGLVLLKRMQSGNLSRICNVNSLIWILRTRFIF